MKYCQYCRHGRYILLIPGVATERILRTLIRFAIYRKENVHSGTENFFIVMRKWNFPLHLYSKSIYSFWVHFFDSYVSKVCVTKLT